MKAVRLFERSRGWLLLAVSCGALTLVAQTDYNVRDAHLTSDVGSGSAFDSDHAKYWSDRLQPTDDKTYYIPGNRTATVGGACRGKWVYVGGTVYASGDVATWTELRLGPAATYRWWSQVGLSGKVVIEGTPDRPSYFSKGHPKGMAEVGLAADFFSDTATSCARFDTTGTLEPGLTMPDYTWQMTGDWSGYAGKLIVGLDACLEWRRADGALPGTVEVEAGGYLTIGNNNFTFGSVNLKDGAILRVRSVNNGVDTRPVEITDALSLGQVRIVVAGTAYAQGSTVVLPLFRLSAAAADGLDLSGVTVDDSAFRNGIFPTQVEVVVEDDAAGSSGGKIVKLVIGDHGARIYKMNKANDSGDASKSAFTAGNESYWVDRIIPTAESTGFLYAMEAITWMNDGVSHDYAGMTFDARGYVYAHCARLGFIDWRLASGKGLRSYLGTSTTDLVGDMHFAGPFSFMVYQDKTLNLHGALHGEGELKITTPVPHVRPVGFLGLYGDNRDFHGEIAVVAPSDSRDPSTTGGTDYRYPLTWKSRYFTVTVTNANALGGVYTGGAAWKSLQVNAAALLKVLGDVRFTEPTRGLFVDGEAQIYVAQDKCFEIGVPLTLGGTLSKTGPGVLELSGEARFIDGSPTTEPLAGTNTVSIRGPVKISSVNAVNGAKLVFKSDAKLLLDFRPQGAGMMETGFRATRWATPFAVETADGKIPVEYADGTPVIDESVLEYRLPICTVPAAVAETVSFALPKVARRKLVVEKRANADGSVTLVANYALRGLGVIIR